MGSIFSASSITIFWPCLTALRSLLYRFFSEVFTRTIVVFFFFSSSELFLDYESSLSSYLLICPLGSMIMGYLLKDFKIVAFSIKRVSSGSSHFLKNSLSSVEFRNVMMSSALSL